MCSYLRILDEARAFSGPMAAGIHTVRVLYAYHSANAQRNCTGRKRFPTVHGDLIWQRSFSGNLDCYVTPLGNHTAWHMTFRMHVPRATFLLPRRSSVRIPLYRGRSSRRRVSRKPQSHGQCLHSMSMSYLTLYPNNPGEASREIS